MTIVLGARPSSIRVGLKLKSGPTRVNETAGSSPPEISKHTKKMTIMYESGSPDKLTENMYCMGDIWPGHCKIDQTANKMTIPRGSERGPIRGTELKVELHRCGSSASVGKARAGEEV